MNVYIHLTHIVAQFSETFTGRQMWNQSALADKGCRILLRPLELCFWARRLTLPLQVCFFQKSSHNPQDKERDSCKVIFAGVYLEPLENKYVEEMAKREISSAHDG